MNEWLIGYLIGWAIWSIVLMDMKTWRDTVASIIVGAIWPVHMPAMILKRLIRQ